MTVCLLALGRGRFEIYSEPPEEPLVPPGTDAGLLRRWAYRAAVQWHELVIVARQATPSGRLGRWRDAIVCRLAETIAEQRTLWALRKETDAVLLYPSTLAAAQARQTLDRVLVGATRHHGLWLLVDFLLLIASAVLMPIPGPNAIADHLLFRIAGHFQSWRGARRAAGRVHWTLCPDQSLAELAALVDVSRDARASRVAAIAARLNLHRLSAYFERVAA